jgi:hypothetical protein
MLTETTDYATIDELENLAKKLPNTEYAIILHDKDTGTDHYHLSMYFKNAKTITTVANKLKIQPNFIQKWDNRTDNLWSYLLHNTKDANNTKADYTEYLNNPNKLRTNIPDFEKRASFDPKGASPLDRTINQILDGTITRKQLLQPDQIKYYYKNLHKIDTAIKLRTESLKYNPPPCTTTYIHGLGGTGKTTQAMTIAQSLYPESYTMASSANDLLQDYTGEKCLIIDDFRPQDHEFTELLALLDPYHRQRTHRSRYYNKPLATELVIITTILPLEHVEHYYQSMNVHEDMKQLRRRITTQMYLDGTNVTNSVYDEQNDLYITP